MALREKREEHVRQEIGRGSRRDERAEEAQIDDASRAEMEPLRDRASPQIQGGDEDRENRETGRTGPPQQTLDGVPAAGDLALRQCLCQARRDAEARIEEDRVDQPEKNVVAA